jgi:hypothetical protein
LSPKRSACVNEGSFAGGRTGLPSISTTWQPILRFGNCLANSVASQNAGPLAIKVDGCDDSRRMRLHNGAIYARCEPEIVRINDEAMHPASLAEGIASTELHACPYTVTALIWLL